MVGAAEAPSVGINRQAQHMEETDKTHRDELIP